MKILFLFLYTKNRWNVSSQRIPKGLGKREHTLVAEKGPVCVKNEDKEIERNGEDEEFDRKKEEDKEDSGVNMRTKPNGIKNLVNSEESKRNKSI